MSFSFRPLKKNHVYIFDDLYQDLLKIDGEPETLRDEFKLYKLGEEFEHEWFCHDRGPDPGYYLSHVHFFPTIDTEIQQWETLFANYLKRHTRTSDRYVLYAYDSSYGYLLIEILDDPGAHDLWQQRYTSLARFEKIANQFCTLGPSKVNCR